MQVCNLCLYLSFVATLTSRGKNVAPRGASLAPRGPSLAPRGAGLAPRGAIFDAHAACSRRAARASRLAARVAPRGAILALRGTSRAIAVRGSHLEAQGPVAEGLRDLRRHKQRTTFRRMPHGVDTAQMKHMERTVSGGVGEEDVCEPDTS